MVYTRQTQTTQKALDCLHHDNNACCSHGSMQPAVLADLVAAQPLLAAPGRASTATAQPGFCLGAKMHAHSRQLHLLSLAYLLNHAGVRTHQTCATPHTVTWVQTTTLHTVLIISNGWLWTGPQRRPDQVTHDLHFAILAKQLTAECRCHGLGSLQDDSWHATVDAVSAIKNKRNE